MFFQLILAILLGLMFGTFTGLTPGIHINLIAVMLLSVSPILLQYTNPIALAVFIIAMSVTHTFLDSIPSIFLGAPESDTALGVLPGHRYLLKGQGMMAVKLTLIGSFGAVILSVFLFPLFLPIVKYGYPIIQDYIAYLLIATVMFMVLRDRKKFWAIIVFFLSGAMGLIVLNTPMFSNPLFPMLSGLFGISTLLISLNESQAIPKQKHEQRIKLRKTTTLKALLSGQFSGFLTAVLPGLGAATAAVISMQITRKLGDNGFMVLMGSINTVNFILSIATLYILDKARNGSIIAVKELVPQTTTSTIIIFLSAALIAGCAGVFLVLKLGKFLSEKITKINYSLLIIFVISFITLLVFLLSGIYGMLILVTATAIGIIPAITKITRTHGMGCLILPVIMYFLL
ncbi:MAG: tripartite tricarboxylate transporter permease [Nanoarchaeota archaeon]